MDTSISYSASVFIAYTYKYILFELQLVGYIKVKWNCIQIFYAIENYKCKI